MRQYLVRLLRRRWNVDAVADGRAVLESVKARRPDLILADMMMPGLGGIGLIRALRENRETAAIPVLLLSANASEASKLEGLRAGATDYLVKPFLARELVAKVQSQVEQLCLRRQADLERERLRSLFEEAPVPICILRGAELRYEFANVPYVRLVGHRELAGKPIREALHEGAAQGMFDVLDEVFRTGKTFWGIEIPIRFDGGGHERPETSRHQLRLSGDARADRDDRRIVVFAIVASTSSSAARSKRAPDATHASRQPRTSCSIRSTRCSCSSASWHAERAARCRAARVGARASANSASGVAAVRLIDNLLDVSRIASGRLQLDLEAVDLAAVVSDLVDRLESHEQAQIIRVSEPTVGHWDRLRLDQVLTNLVSNALKYGEGRPIQITVTSTAATRCSKCPTRASASRRASGADLRTFRACGRGSRYAGFGLGCGSPAASCRSSEWSPSVRSEPGSGSTFIVRLPKTSTPTARRTEPALAFGPSAGMARR